MAEKTFLKSTVFAVEAVGGPRAWAADDGGKILELGSGADLSGLVTLPEGKSAVVINPTGAARDVGLGFDLQPDEAVWLFRTGPSTARYVLLPTGTVNL